MANHETNSQIQTLLAISPVGSLDRVSHVRVIDSQVGSSQDPTLASVFPSGGMNP